MTGKIGQLTLLILSTLGVVHAVTFPLDPPELSEKCLCAEQDDAGWSSQQNRCLSSSVTSCLECPTRQVCAGIKDLAGDGLQIFYGDCRSGSSCIPATESSLGFAVSIALDQQNNVFFSDQGNNRIRMLDVSLNALVTIAGTGAIGFAGDGGLAHQALLRHPEGLALKPNLASGQEVYFADFLNQRLRKLVKSGSDWYIYTVAGTGVMASDSSCDTGCVPLEASLWNPRALAFASNQDLYFVESGSKKILKLTTSIGDPGQNPNATLIAFAGHGLPQSTQGLWASFRGIAKEALPGHYSVPNSALLISGLYTIGIDRRDRLWAVDSDNNRIFMLPLVPNASHMELLGDFGHFLARFEASAFESHLTATERQELQGNKAEALMAWLQAEFPERNLTMMPHTHTKNYHFGYSYWLYGAPSTQQTWCAQRDIQSWGGGECDDVSAQLATFGGIMSVCFDPANNLYLVDNEDSQIVYLEDKKAFQHNSPREAGEKTTEAGCPCEEYWVEDTISIDGEVWLPGAAPYVTEDVITRRSCRENPAVDSFLSQQFGGGSPADIQQMLSRIPNCTAVDYCASAHGDHYPKWCYINARQLPDSQFRTLCAVNTWSWCNAAEQTLTPARWNLIAGATIIGNEKRFETIYMYSQESFDQIKLLLTEDLWLSAGMPFDYSTGSSRSRGPGFFLDGTSILKGFVDTGMGQSQCGDYCCGLTKIRATTLPSGQFGYMCQLDSLANLSVMEAYYQPSAPAPAPAPAPPGAQGAPVTLLTVFEELESLTYGIRPEVDAVTEAKLELCKSRCLYDGTCSGYMITGGGLDILSPGQPCVFYSQSQPFYVYTIDRTAQPFDNGFVNLSVSSDKYQALQAFVGPGIPASRLAGDPDGIYVNHGPVVSKDMISGPHLEYSFLLTECQQLCLENTLCTGIAFPGCYLLQKTTIKLLETTDSYSLMIKEQMQPRVKSGIGYSQADSYNNVTFARQSYLNRPVSCAIDSAGDLIFSDFNHRLRKATGWTTNCTVAGGFSFQQVRQYEAALLQVDNACSSSAPAQLQMLYAEAQMEAIENNSLELVQRYFCDFGSSPFASEMEQNFTNNVFVLCAACASLSPRPSSCPWPSLCDCRDAMVQVAASDVHIRCPQRNAMVDPWHKWITAYTSCWLSESSALDWYSSSMSTLQQQLQSLG